MKKRINEFEGKKYYFLGKDKDGVWYWLEEPSWDCDWYWGFGYLEIYNKPKTDIKEHYHFDSLLKGWGLDDIEKHFSSFVLKEKEMWVLADLMKSYYTLRETASFYHQGSSNYTETKTNIKDLKFCKRINNDIEIIIKEVEETLTPND